MILKDRPGMGGAPLESPATAADAAAEASDLAQADVSIANAFVGQTHLPKLRESSASRSMAAKIRSVGLLPAANLLVSGVGVAIGRRGKEQFAGTGGENFFMSTILSPSEKKRKVVEGET